MTVYRLKKISIYIILMCFARVFCNKMQFIIVTPLIQFLSLH